METSEKRPHRRIPLADCTNTAADTVPGGGRSPEAARANSLAGPIKHRLSNKRKPEKNSSNGSETRSNDIRTASNPISLGDDVSPPQHKDFTPVGAFKPLSNLNSANRKGKEKVVVEPFSFSLGDTRRNDLFPTLYTRRNAATNGKNKEKAAAEPTSCPPLERIRKTTSNEKNNEKAAAEPSSCPPLERIRKTASNEKNNERAAAEPSCCPPLQRIRKTALNEKNNEKAAAKPSSCPPSERIRKIASNKKNKEKAAAEPSSCPPLERIRNIASNKKNKEKAVAKPFSCHPLDSIRNTAANENSKEKAVAEPSSCPPLERMRSELNEGREIRLSKSYSAPNRKKQRVPENDPENDPLEDFIRKQAAYFAEVDAFELPVEVVSDSESE